MKRFIIATTLLISVATGFAFAENEDCMTWHEYETLCAMYGKDAIYTEYENLMSTGGQCILVGDTESETIALFENN